MDKHEKAIEAAATAACGLALTENAGGDTPCTYPDCDCDRAFIRRGARAAIAAFLRNVEPPQSLKIESGFKFDSIGDLSRALCRALAEEIT